MQVSKSTCKRKEDEITFYRVDIERTQRKSQAEKTRLRAEGDPALSDLNVGNPGLHLKEYPPEGSGPKIREDRISDQDTCKCLGSFILIFTREQIYYLKR